jgi:hypothetical protein
MGKVKWWTSRWIPRRIFGNRVRFRWRNNPKRFGEIFTDLQILDRNRLLTQRCTGEESEKTDRKQRKEAIHIPPSMERTFSIVRSMRKQHGLLYHIF